MALDYMIKHPELKFSKTPAQRTQTLGIIIHHPALYEGDVQRIHDAEMTRLGGFPYSIYVRKDGSVHEGRGVNTIGAHCTGQNSTTIGVSFEGYFHPAEGSYKGKVDTSMSEAQYSAGVRLLRDLMGLYPSIQWIKGHKEAPGAATVCPGSYFPLDRMRDEAMSKPETPAPAYPGRLLKYVTPMMRGEDVRSAQKRLLELGYQPGNADGIYGPKTKAAVLAFQKAAFPGLSKEWDGIVGPKTWEAMWR